MPMTICPPIAKDRIGALKAVHVYLSKYSPRPLGHLTDMLKGEVPE